MLTSTLQETYTASLLVVSQEVWLSQQSRAPWWKVVWSQTAGLTKLAERSMSCRTALTSSIKIWLWSTWSISNQWCLELLKTIMRRHSKRQPASSNCKRNHVKSSINKVLASLNLHLTPSISQSMTTKCWVKTRIPKIAHAETREAQLRKQGTIKMVTGPMRIKIVMIREEVI